MYYYHEAHGASVTEDFVATSPLAAPVTNLETDALSDAEPDDRDHDEANGPVEVQPVATPAVPCCAECTAGPPVARQPLHRVGEVRQMQRITVREAQRHLGLSPDEIRRQEQSDCDLKISELYAWQQVLGVPVAELFADPGLNLSPPVQKRAEMVKVMKTAVTLVEKARQPNVKALAQRLVEQLLEVMPELKGINPWPSVGVRRTKRELGRAALGIRVPRELMFSEVLSGD
ncbi:MAG: helix-turn-helix domain-containing protein [Pirellulales bacterium]|nr:helix-turn-helix domain-containing protein [Pirellulales bacterium]